MTEERLDDLIDQHLNGTMDDVTRAELEERLLHSATDRTRFWEMAESHALLHEGLQRQRTEAVAPRVKPRTIWLQWRPLAAAAAGIALTMDDEGSAARATGKGERQTESTLHRRSRASTATVPAVQRARPLDTDAGQSVMRHFRTARRS